MTRDHTRTSTVRNADSLGSPLTDPCQRSGATASSSSRLRSPIEEPEQYAPLHSNRGEQYGSFGKMMPGSTSSSSRGNRDAGEMLASSATPSSRYPVGPRRDARLDNDAIPACCSSSSSLSSSASGNGSSPNSHAYGLGSKSRTSKTSTSRSHQVQEEQRNRGSQPRHAERPRLLTNLRRQKALSSKEECARTTSRCDLIPTTTSSSREDQDLASCSAAHDTNYTARRKSRAGSRSSSTSRSMMGMSSKSRTTSGPSSVTKSSSSWSWRTTFALFVTLAVDVAQGLSNKCRTEFDTMHANILYQIEWETFWRYCGVITQNRLATCCDSFDFSTQRGAGCTESCALSCLFSEYEEFCEGSPAFSFPRLSCTVSRSPMKDSVGELQLKESFCLPESCNTDADLTGIMEHYHTTGGALLGTYADAKVVCPSNTAETVLIVLIVITLVGLIAFGLWYVCRIPPQALDAMVQQQRMVAPEDTTFRARDLALDGGKSSTMGGALTEG
ncbi:unnamed protein product [Amoebophrya sp. A25]|nr:unnamed protein product [Amoebophrya sp. A25]|eukprot:GSA25T00003713001.1